MKDNLLMFVAPVIRALVQVVGGTQIVDSNQEQQIGGAIAVLITIIWSIFEKKKAETKVVVAESKVREAYIKSDVATMMAKETLKP